MPLHLIAQVDPTLLRMKPTMWNSSFNSVLKSSLMDAAKSKIGLTSQSDIAMLGMPLEPAMSHRLLGVKMDTGLKAGVTALTKGFKESLGATQTGFEKASFTSVELVPIHYIFHALAQNLDFRGKLNNSRKDPIPLAIKIWENDNLSMERTEEIKEILNTDHNTVYPCAILQLAPLIQSVINSSDVKEESSKNVKEESSKKTKDDDLWKTIIKKLELENDNLQKPELIVLINCTSKWADYKKFRNKQYELIIKPFKDILEFVQTQYGLFKKELEIQKVLIDKLEQIPRTIEGGSFAPDREKFKKNQMGKIEETKMQKAKEAELKKKQEDAALRRKYNNEKQKIMKNITFTDKQDIEDIKMDYTELSKELTLINGSINDFREIFNELYSSYLKVKVSKNKQALDGRKKNKEFIKIDDLKEIIQNIYDIVIQIYDELKELTDSDKLKIPKTKSKKKGGAEPQAPATAPPPAPPPATAPAPATAPPTPPTPTPRPTPRPESPSKEETKKVIPIKKERLLDKDFEISDKEALEKFMSNVEKIINDVIDKKKEVEDFIMNNSQQSSNPKQIVNFSNTSPAREFYELSVIMRTEQDKGDSTEDVAKGNAETCFKSWAMAALEQLCIENRMGSANQNITIQRGFKQKKIDFLWTIASLACSIIKCAGIKSTHDKDKTKELKTLFNIHIYNEKDAYHKHWCETVCVCFAEVINEAGKNNESEKENTKNLADFVKTLKKASGKKETSSEEIEITEANKNLKELQKEDKPSSSGGEKNKEETKKAKKTAIKSKIKKWIERFWLGARQKSLQPRFNSLQIKSVSNAGTEDVQGALWEYPLFVDGRWYYFNKNDAQTLEAKIINELSNRDEEQVNAFLLQLLGFKDLFSSHKKLINMSNKLFNKNIDMNLIKNTASTQDKTIDKMSGLINRRGGGPAAKSQNKRIHQLNKQKTLKKPKKKNKKKKKKVV